MQKTVTYLIKQSGKDKRAHLWLGHDTACRLWSTGWKDRNIGVDHSEDNRGYPVCKMCMVNYLAAGGDIADLNLIEPTPLPQPGKNEVLLTKEMLKAGLSQNKGYSREQLKLLGISEPYNYADASMAIGTVIPQSAYVEFVRLKDKHIERNNAIRRAIAKKHKRLYQMPQSIRPADIVRSACH